MRRINRILSVQCNIRDLRSLLFQGPTRSFRWKECQNT